MSSKDAGIRQDLVENGVEHELASIQEDLGAAQELGAAVESELQHDLLVWPREYLEPYLDSDTSGTIPLNEVQLQDLLEAAFDRNAELARNTLNNAKRIANSHRATTPAPDSNAEISLCDAQREPTVADQQPNGPGPRRTGARPDLGDAPGNKVRDVNATGKGRQQTADEGQSSLATGISQPSDSVRQAAGLTELPLTARQDALTDSGVYTGRIVAETPELVIQRISSLTEIAHPKTNFIEPPQIGQLVSVAYHDNLATVREVHERKIEKGLSR